VTFAQRGKRLEKYGWLFRWICWFRGHKWTCVHVRAGGVKYGSGPCHRCGYVASEWIADGIRMRQQMIQAGPVNWDWNPVTMQFEDLPESEWQSAEDWAEECKVLERINDRDLAILSRRGFEFVPKV